MKNEKDMTQDLSNDPQEPKWEPPKILEEGRVEARLFSDEPDPWGP